LVTVDPNTSIPGAYKKIQWIFLSLPGRKKIIRCLPFSSVRVPGVWEED
jgi:hypothetical protein